jgi:hyperosmotically inducible protein
MWYRLLPKRFIAVALLSLVALLGATSGTRAKTDVPDPQSSRRGQVKILDEIRKELVTLPWYDVFDWLEAESRGDGTVVLRGETVRPTLKKDAEARVQKVEGVQKVINEIEVLPLSPNDDQLRIALYRAIYKFDSPLFRYATQAVPPIHIIVKNGRVTLKGVIATEMDSQLAYTAARAVPGAFEVTNHLRVENTRTEQ